MNGLKTALLLASLTALMMGIGSYFGGREGMWFAFFIAILMNMWSYWFSDSIVLRTYGAKIVDANEYPDLHRMVSELSSRAGLAMPRIAIVNLPVPNAFATGRNDRHAVVAVTPSILQILTTNELRGVLAHEIGHIKNKDILVSSVAATLAGAISMIVQTLMFFGGGSRDNRGGNPIVMLVMILLTPIMAGIIQMAISRSREYGADDRGAEYANGRDLASALRKLDAYSKRMPLVGEAKHEATAHVFIVNPFRASALMRLFQTHPPIEERVARLESR